MKYTIYLALACMAYSCTPILSIQIPTTHTPLPDSSNYVLLPRTDSSRIDGEEIGKISYQQEGFSALWSYDQIAGWIRRTAMANGADLVKVTDYLPYQLHGLAHVDATLYRAMNLQDYERRISWSVDRRLTLADFKGAPDPVMHSRSRCQFYFRTLFFCTKSWIDRTSADSATLLEHEQGNFDLCEIYRRQFEADRRGLRLYTQKEQSIFQQVYGAYWQKKRQYDTETDNSLDHTRQDMWTRQITRALAKNDGDPDTLFAVAKVFTLRQKDSVAKQLQPPPAKALVYIIRPKNISTPPLMRIVYDPLYLTCLYAIGLNVNKYTVHDNDTTFGPLEGHAYDYVAVDPGDFNFGTGMNMDSKGRRYFLPENAEKEMICLSRSRRGRSII
jgi:hypothetical protein